MDKNKSRLILAGIIAATAGLITLSALGVGSGRLLSAANIRQGLDLQGGASILFEADVDNPSNEEMNSAVSLLRRRLDSKGWMEADAGRQGTKQIRVDIPGVDDPELAMDEIGKTAQLFFADENGVLLLTGSEVSRAWRGTSTNDRGQSEIVVHLEFNSYGAQLFADATRENIGKPIYILLDDEVISYPTVNTVINDGRCFISGNFNAETAEYLATLIREGSLPFRLNVISMNNVGARLGADALQTSILAGVIGIALVLIFMAFFYRFSGLAANLALIIYTALMLLLMSGLRITLTLPGVAGIILSVGMAVDANVVIFERVREEIATGKSLRAAIEAGYKRAFPAILDSNVTSLIVSAILFWLGSGPVKGFAQTLFIGIIVSMFSALVMTKLITLKLVGSGITDPKLYTKQADVSKYLKNAPTFVEWRKYSYVFSGALIAIGAAFAITNAARGVGPFNLDVEFSGGTSFTIDMGGAFENDDVASLVREITGQSAPQIQKILNTNQVMIKIRSIDSETRISLIEAFVDRYDVARDDINYSDISATVSADMQRAAVIAMSVSFVCLLIYISWRFKDIRMGASTVFALMHDAALVIAAYAVLRIPLNYSFIAVMLAVIGYSINANIILFDRVRENRPIMRRETNNKLINTSVAQTLRRTLYSSVSTMLAIVCLYIIGVPSIKEFTLPLLIGLVVGAYSTVFLTGTFWCMLGKKRAA